MGDEKPVRPLDDATAFKASVKTPPVWTIGEKLPTAMDKKNGGLITEFTYKGDLKKEFEFTSLPVQPCYSMGSREAGLLPPPKQPGPGEYKIPSTLDKHHPTEAMPGKGFSWGATGRSAIGCEHMKKNPGPTQYEATRKLGSSSEPSLKSPPQWTIGTKKPDPADKQIRPGCTKYKVQGLLRDGPVSTPAWSLVARKSQISQTRSSWPGPGSYYPHIEANGRKDRKPKWALYAGERWKPPRPREPPY